MTNEQLIEKLTADLPTIAASLSSKMIECFSDLKTMNLTLEQAELQVALVFKRDDGKPDFKVTLGIEDAEDEDDDDWDGDDA